MTMISLDLLFSFKYLKPTNKYITFYLNTVAFFLNIKLNSKKVVLGKNSRERGIEIEQRYKNTSSTTVIM